MNSSITSFVLSIVLLSYRISPNVEWWDIIRHSITAVLAASELITRPAHTPEFHYPGPLSHSEIDKHIPGFIASLEESKARNNETCFRQRAGNSYRCNGAQDLRHTLDEGFMSQGTSRTRPSSSSLHDSKPRSLAPLQARTLPPLQNAIQTPASHDAFQRTNTQPDVSLRSSPPGSTPPDQRSSRPIGVQNLLNPAGNDLSGSQTRQGNAGHFVSPPTPSSMGPTSRGATPSLPMASGPTRSPIEGSLPNITPPLVTAYPAVRRSMTPRSPTTWPQNAITTGVPSGSIDARQSPFIVPRDQITSSNAPALPSLSDTGAAHPLQPRPFTSSRPPAPPSPHRRGSGQEHPYQPWQNYARSGGVGSESYGSVAKSQRSDSPESQYSSYSHATAPASMPPTAAPGQPQSFFSNPFANSRPASTMSQSAMGGNAKTFDMPASSTTAQSQYQMMTLETPQGPVQVPVDVQAASKVADEKRKRNATASHRFRQRRKEKERETSDSIAKLEAQIRDMAEEKEHYQRERDYFHEMTMRHRIPVAPRPPSPRRRRHASLGGSVVSHYQENEGNGRSGRQTRRRTSAYAPPLGPSPVSAEPPPMPPMPQGISPYERVAPIPPEHMQGPPRIRPQGSYPPNPGYQPGHR